MSFPLFHRPGTVAFLDDDLDYLEMLAMVLPSAWHVKLFLRPADCIRELQREPPFWEADAWTQQQLVDEWRQGKPLIPQILRYWSTATERFLLTRVCVVDYSMPGMNGLDALAQLSEWQGSRVLLTGQADEQVAVRAFNLGLIDQFIPKQSDDISGRLIGAVEQLLGAPHPQHAQIWRATLKPAQHALVRHPQVAPDLRRIVAGRWVEHVTIGDPFGVIGMDASGRVGWLQLETPQALQALAEMATLEGVSAADVQSIREGRRLANLELRQSLGGGGAVQLADAFPVGSGQLLWGAFFALDPAHAPDPANSYEQWLQRQPRRAVRD